MNNEKEAKRDELKDVFGILPDTRYNLVFNVEDWQGVTKSIKGTIIHFDSIRILLKAEDGFYFISTKNIIELRPIKSIKL